MMGKALKSNVYEASDSSRKSVDHIYTALSPGRHSENKVNLESANNEYTYVDETNLQYHTKQHKKVNRLDVFDRKIPIGISFVLGLGIGIALTTVGFLSSSTSTDTVIYDGDHIESPPGNKTFITPESYQFRMLRCEIGDTPFQQKFLSFAVKACSDVYVVLTSRYDDSGQLAEIAIGSNGNTRSGIRTEKRGENRVVCTSSLLNCRRFIQFWISWKSKQITVGLGSDENEDIVMTFKDDRSLKILNIGISTGRGTTGEWLFVKK